jgi:hypothetical protein
LVLESVAGICTSVEGLFSSFARNACRYDQNFSRLEMHFSQGDNATLSEIPFETFIPAQPGH